MFSPFDEGILVPLFGIFFLIAIILGPQYFRTLDRKRMHETLRLAIEKGQPLPPEFLAVLQTDVEDGVRLYAGPHSDLRRGLVMVFVGLGICGLALGLYFGLSAVADERVGAIVGGSVAGGGAIPGMIGVAYLLLWAVNRNNKPPVG